MWEIMYSRLGCQKRNFAKMPKKQCYLCGEAADTLDHIPPRGFFPKPWPPNLLTVPCCTPCNNRLSPLDEQMRVLLASDEHANESAKQIAAQKIFTNNSVKGRPFRTVAATLKTFPISVDGTIQVAHSLSARTDDLFRFVQRIIRGLASKYYPEIYEPKDLVVVEGLSTLQIKNTKDKAGVKELFDTLSAFVSQMNHDCFGNGVLDFFHQRVDGGTAWILSFYRGATFLGIHSKNAPPHCAPFRTPAAPPNGSGS
jgi:hypothetical protein